MASFPFLEGDLVKVKYTLISYVLAGHQNHPVPRPRKGVGNRRWQQESGGGTKQEDRQLMLSPFPPPPCIISQYLPPPVLFDSFQ